VSQQTATPQLNRFFGQYHLAAMLDQDTLDKLADRFALDDLRARRSQYVHKPQAQPMCLSCGDYPCTCNKYIYA